MLIRLLDINMKHIGNIIAKDVKIEKSLEMCEQKISFSTMDYVENEYYIDTMKNIFVVKENTKGQNGYRNIKAELNLDGLKGTYFSLFQTDEGGMEIYDCLQLALRGTGWRVTKSNITGMDNRKRGITMSNVTAYDVIKKICEVYNCEVSWNEEYRIISISPQIGNDMGLHFMTGLNVREFSNSMESYEYYTRIIPIGKDGLDIKSVNDGKDYLENYQHTSKVKTLIWEDSNYTDPTALMEDAKYKLNELSKPKKTISIKIVDLSALNKGAYFNYDIGDIVTVVDGETKTREKMRIVKTVKYTADPMKNTCELSSTILSFEEMQKKLFAAANSINNVTNGNILIGGKMQGLKASQVEGLENKIEYEPAGTLQFADSTVTIQHYNCQQVIGDRVFVEISFKTARNLTAGQQIKLKNYWTPVSDYDLRFMTYDSGLQFMASVSTYSNSFYLIPVTNIGTNVWIRGQFTYRTTGTIHP